MGRTAFLFPGQGAQKPGMGRDFFAAYAPARETFEAAGRALGWDVARLCFDGSQEELNRTAVCQPAILTVSIAIWRAMAQDVPELVGSCQAAAGLSLGEYGALVAAGALDFVAAARLLEKRGQFMEQACAERSGTMMSILGLEGVAVRALCEEFGGGEVVAANFNCPGQVAISGATEAVKRVARACTEHGAKRAMPLAVAGAFHSPLMQSAAVKLEAELAGASFREASFPVVANVSAGYVRRLEEIRPALAAQVTGSVLWEQSMRRLAADGFDRFIEVGPGGVLSGLMRRIAPEAQTINVATTGALLGLKSTQ